MSAKGTLATRIQRLGGFSRMCARNFDRDKCFILASSVVYSTLISAVPFLAFVISLLTAFGAFDLARETFLEFFTQQFGFSAGSQMVELAESFIGNAASMGVVGLVSFLFTSVFLINRVWVTINQIYRTSLNRNQIGRFAQFITVLVIGTLLVSAYFSVNALMSRFLSQFFAFSLFLTFLGSVGPWLIIFMAFLLLIFFIPNTKVKGSSALLGALFGTVAFQLANYLFTQVILKLLNYSIIYGSLATILIFLVWMYIWWVIIFAAVEIAYVHQYRPDEKKSAGLPSPPAEQLASGIDILGALSEHFKQGKGAMSVRDIGLELKIPDRMLHTYLELLEQTGFILPMERSGHHYIPARPLEDMKIGTLLEILYGHNRYDSQFLSAGERMATTLYEKGIGPIAEVSIDSLCDDQKNGR